MARVHMLGGRGVQPSWPLQLTMRPWGMAAPMVWAHRLGARAVQLNWCLLPTVSSGMADPNGVGSNAGGTGSPAQPVFAAQGAPEGDGSPYGAGSQAGETGTPARPVVAAHAVLVGDGNPQWRELTGWGDGESNPAGGRNSRCVFGEWRAPLARVHELGGTGSLAHPVVADCGAAPGDGSTQRRGATGCGDGEYGPVVGRSSRCACGGWQPPKSGLMG